MHVLSLLSKRLAVWQVHYLKPGKDRVVPSCLSMQSGLFRFLLSIALLALFLSGCGPDSAAHASSATAPPRPTVTATPPPTTPASALALNPAASVDMSGLHIQTIGDPSQFAGMQCDDWIVLTGQQQTYDAGTVQQMQTFVRSAVVYAPGYERDVNLIQLSQTTVPAPLAVVLGTAGTLPLVPQPGTSCDVSLDITNTSQQAIQLLHAGITYATSSSANTFPYRLVDYCTLATCAPCSSGCGAAAGCSYFAKFQLPSGSAGTHVDAGIQSDGSVNCPLQPTLSPGMDQTVDVQITSRLPSQDYRLALTLTIDTGTGPITLTLPATFASNVAFADPSQFTCYGLRGDTFVLESPPLKNSCI